MRVETQEAIHSIYLRVLKQLRNATLARNAATAEQHRLMMAGKVKAYADVLNLIESRHGKKVLLPSRTNRNP